MQKELLKYKDELVSLRRDFHKNPELGFKELRTAAVVESYLQKLGLQTTRIAKTGIISTITSNKPGKTIALRADMDALPIEEKNELEYSSKNIGVMHACGHDGHMAILLVLAKYLTENKEKWSGTVRLIFQPAEEGEGGAQAMIDEGALIDPKVEAIFGLHLLSTLPISEINLCAGPMMAASSSFEIDIIGKGGHGAMPHQTIDSLYIAAQFISSVQSIVSRIVDPMEPAVLSFGRIYGGDNYNVIASKVKIEGTLRAFNDKVMSLLKKNLGQQLNQVCSSFSAQHKLKFNHNYSPVVNDKKLTLFVQEQIKSKEHLHLKEKQYMVAEDFSSYGKEIPACFYFVGAGNEKKGFNKPHHHQAFDFDEDALLIALELMSSIVENY